MGDQASVYSRAEPSSIFDEDGKLSSANAASTLKYARPQDLPSFPSTGGVKMSSASAAANLANKNQKPFEYWKPDPIPAANKAALLAKDYTAKPSWQPESSKAGSDAASTAHGREAEFVDSTPNQSVSKSKPKEPSSWALQAATKSHKIQNAAKKQDASRQLYTSNPSPALNASEKQRQDMLKASAIVMARKMFLIQQQHIDEAAGRTSSSKPGTQSRGPQSVSEANTNTSGYENLEEAARRLAQERLAKIHDEHAEYRNYYTAQPSPPARTRLSVRMRRREAAARSRDRDDDSDEEQSRRIRSQMTIFQSKLAEVDNKKRQQDRDALLVIARRNVDAQISKLDERVLQETGKASPAQMEKWERSARDIAQADSDVRMQNTGKVHIGGGRYIDQSELDAIARARLAPTLEDIAYKAEQQRAKDEELRLEKVRADQAAQTEKTKAAAVAAEAKYAKEKVKLEEKIRKDAAKRESKTLSDADKQRRRDTLAATKESERLDKEEKRKLQGDKPPGRLSTLLSRGSSYGQSSTPAVAAGSDGTSDDSGSAREVEADETTFHDLVTGNASSANAAPTAYADESQAEAATTERPVVERAASEDDKDGITSPSKNKTRVKSWMRVRFRSKSGTLKDAEVMPVVAESSADPSNLAGDEAAAKDSSRPESMRDVAMAGRASHESDDLYGPPRAVSPQGSKVSQDKARDRSASISSISSHYSEETKDAKSARSEEATIGEAKAVEIKPQTSSELNETETDARGRSGFKARLLRKITPNKTATGSDKSVTPTASNTENDEFEEARDTFEEEKSSAPLSSAAGEQGNSADQKSESPKTSREGSRFTEDL